MCIIFYGFLSIINYIQGYIYSRPPKKNIFIVYILRKIKINEWKMISIMCFWMRKLIVFFAVLFVGSKTTDTVDHQPQKIFFCCWKNALIGLVSLNWFCCPNVLVSFGILWNWKGKCVANFGCWCGFAFKFYVMDESLRKFRSSKGELRFLLWNVLKIDSRSSFLAKFSNLVALKLVIRN